MKSLKSSSKSIHNTNSRLLKRYGKNNLRHIYEEYINIIRNKLKGQYIWIAVDETQDIFGHRVLNVIVGALNSDRVMQQIYIKH